MVVVGPIHLEGAMRGDRRPALETGRGNQKRVLVAASAAQYGGEGSIGVLIGGDTSAPRGDTPRGRELDLCHPHRYVARIRNREAQGSPTTAGVEVIGDEIAIGVGHAGLNPDGEVSRLAFPGLAKPFLIGLKGSNPEGDAEGTEDDPKRAGPPVQTLFIQFPSR